MYTQFAESRARAYARPTDVGSKKSFRSRGKNRQKSPAVFRLTVARIHGKTQRAVVRKNNTLTQWYSASSAIVLAVESSWAGAQIFSRV